MTGNMSFFINTRNKV